MNDKETLIISVSGGRTSMYMAVWAHRNLIEKYNLVFIFCNTGLEHEETLEFVSRVSEFFAIEIIWIETVIHHGVRKGPTYKIVDFKTASRNGEPFEEVIKKHGIPNKAYPHCNRDLKLRPMFAWRKDNAAGAKFAVGIRSDEIDRISSRADKDGVVYPLISWNPKTKIEIVEWWGYYPDIDLNIPEHHGNCKTCWKKSDRKLMTIARENPSWFEFMDRMERNYGKCGANDDSRVFFRGKNSARELVGRSYLEDFKPFDQSVIATDLDISNGCDESCEPFTDFSDTGI